MWMEIKHKKIRWFQAWIEGVDYQGDWPTLLKISKQTFGENLDFII